MIGTGTYVGTDFEMVVTDNFIITFCRNKQEDILESRLFKRINHHYSCIGICQSSPTETEQRKPPMCWKTAFIYNGKLVGTHQILQNFNSFSQNNPPIYSNETDEQIIAFIGSSLTVDPYENSIKVTFDDHSFYIAVPDERFTENDLSPELPSVCKDNIGVCLRLWNMGVTEEIFDIDGTPTFIGVTINTNKHMYIFEITPSSIYCRAARFATTNKGVVFNQNFRQGFESYMIMDNTESLLPLSYDETLFHEDSCLWNSRSVYWSLSSYNAENITLNGCQGDIYHWKKPQR